MGEENNDLLIDMGVPTTTPSIIKVIGVGGGGGNAVNHMYREGIHDVNFVVCNVLSVLAKQQRKVLIKFTKCSMMAQRWCSSLRVWVVVLVQVQPL